MTTETLTYEQRRAQEEARQQARHQIAVQVSDQLVLQLNRAQQEDRGIGPANHWVRSVSEYKVHVTDLSTSAEIAIYPGGYGREKRIVASVVDVRHVQLGPADWDTVRTGTLPNTLRTYSETKDPAVIAKQIRQQGVVASAIDAAVLLDAAEARARAERDKGAATVAEFRDAGWEVSTGELTHVGFAYVPDGHALRLLGVSSLRIDLKTGALTYSGTPYLPRTTVPEDLIGLADFRLPSANRLQS